MRTEHLPDHVAALAEAEQRVRDDERATFQEAVWTFDRGHAQGRAEALREAREAVKTRCRLLHRKERTADCYHCRGVVAVIDALRGES